MPVRSSLPPALSTFKKLHTIILQTAPHNWGLAGGRLGLCIYHTHLHRLTGTKVSAQRAVAHLRQAFAEAPVQQQGFGFANGLAGLCYTINYMYRAGLVDGEVLEGLPGIEKMIFENALRQMEAGQHDYLHGAMGAVHYLLGRLPHPGSETMLRLLLELFCQQAIAHEHGGWFQNKMTGVSTTPEINFSLSHGLCGFLLLLLNAYEKGVTLPAISASVERGIDLLLYYSQKPTEVTSRQGRFPQTVLLANDEPQWNARLAWCYGDLNVLLLLYKAASVLKKPQWKLMADEWGPAIASRTVVENTLITDSHFCHGSSGLVAFYKRLYQHSRQLFYYHACEYWLQQTLNRLPKELETRFYKGKEADLLEGLPGIALVLLDTAEEKATGIEPDWLQLWLL
jgi:lantibiotic biosynthesis protein